MDTLVKHSRRQQIIIVLAMTGLLSGHVWAAKSYNFIRNGVVVDSLKGALADNVPVDTSASTRKAVLADFMEAIKNTKDAKWLLRELDKPDTVNPLGQTHAEWIWETKYSSKYICKQIFYVRNDGKIEGWQTDCPNEVYGTVPKSTPVLPITIKVNHSSRGAYGRLATYGFSLKRAKEFLDFFPEFVGQSEVVALKKFGKPVEFVPMEKGHYLYTWSKSRYAGGGLFFEPMLVTCRYSVAVNSKKIIAGWTLSENCQGTEWEDYGRYGYLSTTIPRPKLDSLPSDVLWYKRKPYQAN